MKKFIPFAIFLLCLVYFIFRVIIPAMGEVTHGYIAYYASAKLFASREYGSQAYDNSWTFDYILTLTDGKIGDVISPNFPTMGMTMLPLSGFSPMEARGPWIVFNTIIFFLGLGLLILTQKNKWANWNWLFLGGALLMAPVTANFTFGQIFTQIFFLFSVVMYGLFKEDNRLIGVALGLAFIIKIYGLILWIIPFYKRNWQALGWAAGTCIILFLTSLPWVGLDSWLKVIPSVINTNAAPMIAITAYQSTPGFLAHWFRGDPILNPHPLFQSDILAFLLPLIIGAIAFGLSLIIIPQGKHDLLWAAALIPLNTLLIPNALEHHFVLFIIPIFILLDNMYNPLSTSKSGFAELGLLTGGILLIGLPWPYKHPLFADGWMSLLAYPRLYGGWMIWALALLRAKRFCAS